MGELNNHVIDNGGITSDVPVESSYDSVPYPDTPPIKYIDDDEMDHQYIWSEWCLDMEQSHRYIQLERLK